MIQYSLVCDSAHQFDAWFKSSDAFAEQEARGILSCPVCNSTSVEKAVMAPAVARTDTGRMTLSARHPEHAKMIAAMREMRRKMVESSDYVGPRFAEEARKMHFGELEARVIHGEASAEEAEALIEDGIDFLPLPHLPDEHN